MALFSNFKWYDWFFAPTAAYKMTKNLGNDIVSSASDVVSKIATGHTRAENEESSALAYQQALQHAEQREDNAIQRQTADLQAAGLNPVLAGSLGGSSSGAAMQAVYSRTQEQQAQAQQMQALSSLISSAAMLFLTKGKGIPVVSGTGSSAKGTTYINHAYYMRK